LTLAPEKEVNADGYQDEGPEPPQVPPDTPIEVAQVVEQEDRTRHDKQERPQHRHIVAVVGRRMREAGHLWQFGGSIRLAGRLALAGDAVRRVR
jgi:hypothetical protein